jgi:hypothetical protein
VQSVQVQIPVLSDVSGRHGVRVTRNSSTESHYWCFRTRSLDAALPDLTVRAETAKSAGRIEMCALTLTRNKKKLRNDWPKVRVDIFNMFGMQSGREREQYVYGLSVALKQLLYSPTFSSTKRL